MEQILTFTLSPRLSSSARNCLVIESASAISNAAIKPEYAEGYLCATETISGSANLLLVSIYLLFRLTLKSLHSFSELFPYHCSKCKTAPH